MATDGTGAPIATSREARGTFDELYEQYRTPLYNYIYRLVGDRDQADDVLQETFIKVYRALDSVPHGPGRTPWLYRVATNTCYDLLRRRRLIAWLPWSREHEARVDTDAPGLGERYAMSEGVHDALRCVPVPLRAPLLLHVVHGFSYGDIAHTLGISEAAVKMRISRARAAFRGAYHGEDERTRT